MAIRKLRQKMKPVIWVITIAMFLGMIIGGISSMRATATREPVAFKLNGKKVTSTNVERAISNTVNGYSQYLGNAVDREILSIIAFGSVVDKQLTIDIAKKLKVKVSKSEVNAEFDKIKASVEDKQQFSRMLQAQGYNVSTLKDEIKESLTVQKVIEQVKEDAKPTEVEVQEFYNENTYGTYYGKEFEDVKAEIESSLQEQNGMEEYVRLLEQEKKEMKLTDIDPKYANYEEKTQLEIDGFEFSNLDMAGRVLRNLFATQGDKVAAEQMAKQSLEQEVKLANAAINMGIEKDETMSIDNQLFDLRVKLSEKLKSDYKIDESEINAYFEEKKIVYDILPSVDANIALFEVTPTDTDKAESKTKAEEVLTELTPENFAEMAVKYSEGPTGPKGGDLGWFGKGQMVPAFEEAAFNTEAGTVHTNVVESQFGYHLIFVEEKNDDEVKASHILFTPKVSEETKEAVLTEASEVAERVTAGELTFEDLKKGSNVTIAQKFEGISEGGYIPGIGYKDQLAKNIFAGDLNKGYSLESEGEIYVYEKTKVVEYKEAILEEMREKVEYDFLNEKVQEELGKILEVENN